MIPARVDRTVIRVWLRALWWFIELDNFLIIIGLRKLSIKVPASIAPKKIMMKALVVSPIANKYSDKGSQTNNPPSTGIKPASAIATPKNNAGKPIIITPIENTTP